MSCNKQIEQFPTIIRVSRDACSVEVPDLNITVTGDNYTQAIGRAIEAITAVCVYRKERNIAIRIKETFESCAEKTIKEKGKHFVYMLGPVYAK